MGLFGTLKKAFKIGEMKADQALDDAINPIDKAKLNIKEKRSKLATAKKSLTKARETFYLEKNKLTNLVNKLQDLEGKKAKLVQTMQGFQKKGLSPEEIKAKVGKVFVNITEEMGETQISINSQKLVSDKHEKTVEKFDDMIKLFDKEISKDENEVKLLESEYNMADTSSAIADAMNDLNSDGSADDIAQLRAKKDVKAAKANAMIDSMMAGKETETSLDELFLESSSGGDSELDALLGLGLPSTQEQGKLVQ